MEVWTFSAPKNDADPHPTLRVTLSHKEREKARMRRSQNQPSRSSKTRNPQRNVCFSHLGCTSLRISNQSIFAFNDVRTNPERVAVYAPNVTEAFGSKLGWHNIYEKLPHAWNLGKREDQVSQGLRKVLADQH